MIVSCWNIRGFNKHLKQDGVLSHIRKNKVDIMGILETKLNHQSNRDMVKHKFRNWGIWDNFHQHPNGRIMIIWKADKVDLQMLNCSEQVIHCLATCKVTNTRFCISFVYAFNTIMGRRPLWANLDKFNETLRDLWLILGDFNNVLKMDEKSNDQLVTPYEIRDFQ
ncbi:Endonuclease [Actinidia chinensis var. chinensis]|uniref:Endonuclease n=1 Tax=Actinidia chinensis var. chinensis TaxID=1590841 RepID=A0A2R6R229_ACTCC|nr:Endonuclease [Actinidia chinensis var. chinensis]